MNASPRGHERPNDRPIDLGPCASEWQAKWAWHDWTRTNSRLRIPPNLNMATVTHGQYPQRRPNGLWRGASSMTMGLTGSISKLFLNGFNSLETVGLDKFLDLVESRHDPFERQRGLITGVCFLLPATYVSCANPWLPL